MSDLMPPSVQTSAKRLVRGCEKFVSALAYLFRLALPGSRLARFAYLLAVLCIPIPPQVKNLSRLVSQLLNRDPLTFLYCDPLDVLLRA